MTPSITLAGSTSEALPCEFCGGPVQIVSRPIRQTPLGRAYRQTRHCLSDCEKSCGRALPRERTAVVMRR